MSGAGGKVVCVTGASGYIGSWMVKLLLERGYTVKATVRDPNDPNKTRHLISLIGANERLHLFQANLLDDGSFDKIVDGCEGVFHSASPVNFAVSNPQFWYPLSKTLAENVAWKFTEEHGIDMVAINPGWVVGPILQPSVGQTVEPVLNLVNGAESFPNEYVRLVDVRDVAYAHILAFEIPSANGRYCLVERTAHWSQVVKVLQEVYPTLQLPNKCSDSFFNQPNLKVSKEKAHSLGIKFIPLEVSLKDTVESLKEKNFVSF